jgi:hypothetical protein
MSMKEETFAVEKVGDLYQSVFPSDLSQYGDLHTTEQDAWAWINEVKQMEGREQ